MKNSTVKTERMVSKCFIYGCTKYCKGQTNPTFGVPKDPDLLQKWADILRPYSNGKTLLSRHRICHKHFKSEDLEHYYVHLIHGTEIKIEKHRPTLKKGAVPTILPGQKKKDDKKVLKRKNVKKPIHTDNKGIHQESRSLPLDLINTVEFPVFVEDLSSVEDEEALIAKYQVTGEELQNSNSVLSKPTDEDSFEDQVFPEKQILLETEQTSYKGALPDCESLSCPEKQVPVLHINWDALPLPEEVGPFFCSSNTLGGSTTSNFNIKLPPKNSSSLHCFKVPTKSGSTSSAKVASEEQSNNRFLSLLSNRFKSLMTDSTHLNCSSTCNETENIPELSVENDLEPPPSNGLECPVASSAEHKSYSTEDFIEESPLHLPIANAPLRVSKPVASSAEHKSDSTEKSPLQPPTANTYIRAPKAKRLPQKKADLATTENKLRNIIRQDIEDIPLSYSEFQKRFTELKLPSSLWGSHKDQRCIFFSLLTFETHGYRAVPRVERIVMYEGCMLPRIFLRTTEVRVPSISQKESNTMLAVFDVLCRVEDLRLCLGINKADECLAFSPGCDVFLDSVKLSRCPACRKEREAEYKKKRHLENEESKSGYRSRKRKKLW